MECSVFWGEAEQKVRKVHGFTVRHHARVHRRGLNHWEDGIHPIRFALMRDILARKDFVEFLVAWPGCGKTWAPKMNWSGGAGLRRLNRGTGRPPTWRVPEHM